MKRTQLSIFLFWVPLAATWVMMASEGPFLTAIIARLGDPTYNLAAFGVAFAFGILVEGPVIMLMSASTALAKNWVAFLRLRRFTWGLNALSTALLGVLLIPPVFRLVMESMLGLPREITDLVYGGLLFLLPWPAAIGYRRFVQGVLIRANRTRLVAYGTVLRVLTMVGSALALYQFTDLPGAWVGTAALSSGVLVEAFAARLMALPTLRELEADSEATAADAPGYGEIARFYYPLALTSMIGLTIQPMLTFFMGRAPSPIESLAVFPVVNALSFLFRSLGLSFQEAAIALIGDDYEHVDAVGRFALWLGLASSGALALVAFTPLADLWFVQVSGLTPELAAMAIVPTMILVPMPGISVWLSYQRGILVNGRRTKPITVATAIEVGMIAILFVIGGWGFGWVGVTAAFFAFVGARTAANLFLRGRARSTLRRAAKPDFAKLANPVP
jgi:Na+-driven multidrug efflux pump